MCDFLLMINTNLRQVIADYWSNFRFRQRVPLPTTPMNPQIQDHEIHIQETTNNKLCKLHFDILNRLGVAHECDRQTDRTAFSNNAV